MIALRMVRGVTHHFAWRWAEWLFSAILFSLGMKLLQESETFASSPSFRVMASFASENHWGVFLCIVAGLRLAALTLNGTFRPFARISPLVRAVFGFLSGFAWFTIAMGIYLSNPEGWGYITYGGLLLGDMTNAILAAGDAGATERKFRNGRAL